jgi:hypothetical protein
MAQVERAPGEEPAAARKVIRAIASALAEAEVIGAPPGGDGDVRHGNRRWDR